MVRSSILLKLSIFLYLAIAFNLSSLLFFIEYSVSESSNSIESFISTTLTVNINSLMLSFTSIFFCHFLIIIISNK